MDFKEKERNKEKSLRAVSPKLYEKLISECKPFHIHPYDIQASAIKQDSGILVILRFGEGFTQKKTRFFSFEAIEKHTPEIIDYFKETIEACKKVLIADYFKLVKP